MAKRAKQRADAKDKKLKRTVFLISCAVLAIQLILILSVKHGGWLGDDGESYLYGVEDLSKSGFD